MRKKSIETIIKHSMFQEIFKDTHTHRYKNAFSMGPYFRKIKFGFYKMIILCYFPEFSFHSTM